MNILHAPIFPDAIPELTATFLPFNMILDYELWQVTRRWGPRPGGDFSEIGVGFSGWGWGGSSLLFLFQLDRIGTLAQGGETQTLSRSRKGSIKPGEKEEIIPTWNKFKKRLCFLWPLLCLSLKSNDWHRCWGVGVGWGALVLLPRGAAAAVADWLPAHNLITPLQTQGSPVALCADMLPSENGVNLNWQQLTVDSKLLMAERSARSF